MAHDYRYIPASMGIKPRSGKSPKNVYTELFEETLRDQFYNSSNWWTIQEQTSIGSADYVDVDVRITHLINAETGLKLGDDWKTLLFSDINHPVELGKQYSFDDNIWLTTNTEIAKNLSATCTIRRCNNTLRWIDEHTGAYYEEPCAIEYMVKEPRDYFTQGSPFKTPGGFLHIEMQFNERTNKINENQRFLFGNPNHWTCYTVIGTGLNDFRNNKTYEHSSTKILSIDMIADFVNPELDDIVNGIADVHTNVYTVSLNKTSLQGAPASTVQLIPSVTYNGDSVVRPMTWVSSASPIASVSTNGLVTFVSAGSCVITANVTGNSASAICAILVTGSPVLDNEIRISPDNNYILEGSQKTYSVFLYKNDALQGDSFVITCVGGTIPSANYTFTQTDGNHFSIMNKIKDVSSSLVIHCVTTGSPVYTKDYNIFLKGGW